LQRLAEVRVAQGDGETAMRLLHEALPLARTSMISKHLLQRIFGTMIVATDDPTEARAIVDRAESTLGWDDVCLFCSIMLAVPATIACARVGDLDNARRLFTMAEQSAVMWQGTSWEGGMAEAHAAIEVASGEPELARKWMEAAAERFQRAGQPLDAERCLHALVDF
jgi:hypothetical protein